MAGLCAGIVTACSIACTLRSISGPATNWPGRTPAQRPPLWTVRASRASKRGEAHRSGGIRRGQEGQRQEAARHRRHAGSDARPRRHPGQCPRPGWLSSPFEAGPTLVRIPEAPLCRRWLLFADGGYSGVETAAAVKRVGKMDLEIVTRSDQTKGFVILP